LPEAVAVRPGRSPARLKGRERARPPLPLRALAALGRRPATVAGSAVVAAAATAIALNALSFQAARHPAPLFGTKEARPEVRAAGGEKKPLQADAKPLAAKPAEAPPARPAQSPPVPPAKRDAIGDLLRGGEATGAVPKPADKVAEPQRIVSAAQRALVKAGYGPLSTDGVIGPATRAAIERFERDHRIAVTGALGPRTVKELSAAAGFVVE